MITPIEGLNSYMPITSVQPLNYAVENTSEVSESFLTESTKKAAGVNAVSPVKYPNAQVVQETRFSKSQQARDVSKAYNEIANSLNETNTGYSSTSKATYYESKGNVIDLYA